MKKLLIILMLFLLCPISITAHAGEQENQEQLAYDTLLTTLSPHITKAILNYYGEPKQYGLYDAKILNIKRLDEGSFVFDVIVQIKTFEHAHNPPYGLETITMHVDSSDVTVSKYEHKGDSWEQKIRAFKKGILNDIQKTFNLDLQSYTEYKYGKIIWFSEQEEFKSLAQLNQEIFKQLSKDIHPPYINVIAPFTFIKGNQGYILFKKADGTNFVYTLTRENNNWKVIKKESKQGKKMPKELLWYMALKNNSSNRSKR